MLNAPFDSIGGWSSDSWRSCCTVLQWQLQSVGYSKWQCYKPPHETYSDCPAHFFCFLFLFLSFPSLSPLTSLDTPSDDDMRAFETHLRLGRGGFACISLALCSVGKLESTCSLTDRVGTVFFFGCHEGKACDSVMHSVCLSKLLARSGRQIERSFLLMAKHTSCTQPKLMGYVQRDQK